MDWQQLIALLIVAATALLLVWSKLRRRKLSFARDTHCGCGAIQEPPPSGSIVFRARKGHRAEVLVKMR